MLIENAPGSGDAPAEGAGARPHGSGPRRRYADRALHGHVRGLSRLDLLFAAAGRVGAARTRVSSLPAAGPIRSRPREQQARRRALASDLFAGQRQAEEIPDISTPPTCSCHRGARHQHAAKIYQYLRSGRAIVATRLVTHTQVLDDDVAILTPATPQGFGEGILAALVDRAPQAERRRNRASTKNNYCIGPMLPTNAAPSRCRARRGAGWPR